MERRVKVAITASEARKNLFPLIEKVNADRTPVEITSKAGRAVLVAADDWEAWQETAYLFRSPENARRLLDAAAALEEGRGVRADLDLAE
jgi:antitoxin YefM